MNDKIKIRIEKLEKDNESDFTLNQQIATGLVLLNEIYDWRISDETIDYIELEVNVNEKDKCLIFLNNFKREVIVL